MECTIMSSSHCGNRLIKGKKGQVKIIEGLLTLIIVISALSFLVYFGGVHKTEGQENTDPAADQTAVIRGPVSRVEYPVGGEYVTNRSEDHIEMRIPAGALALLAFPDLPMPQR